MAHTEAARQQPAGRPLSDVNRGNPNGRAAAHNGTRSPVRALDMTRAVVEAGHHDPSIARHPADIGSTVPTGEKDRPRIAEPGPAPRWSAAAQQGPPLSRRSAQGGRDHRRHARRRRRRPRPPPARLDRRLVASGAAHPGSAGPRRTRSRSAPRRPVGPARQRRPAPGGRHGRPALGRAPALARAALAAPVGPLLCVINRPTRGRYWTSAAGIYLQHPEQANTQHRCRKPKTDRDSRSRSPAAALIRRPPRGLPLTALRDSVATPGVALPLNEEQASASARSTPAALRMPPAAVAHPRRCRSSMPAGRRATRGCAIPRIRRRSRRS